MRKRLALWFLGRTGWEPEGVRPTEPRFVLIAAPHTSNWDLPYLLALAVVFDVRVSWMGKHGLFRPPLGWLMRRLGGIPVVRHRRGNLVAQMARAFGERESLALVVPAEGTRGYVTHWKSGFYRIAEAARVPIVPTVLDFGRRRVAIGEGFVPSGSTRSDMDRLRAFYAGSSGRYPDQAGPVRLEDEN